MRNSKRKDNKTNNKNKGDRKKRPVFLPGEANDEGVFKGQAVANDNGPSTAIKFPKMWIGKVIVPNGV